MWNICIKKHHLHKNLRSNSVGINILAAPKNQPFPSAAAFFWAVGLFSGRLLKFKLLFGLCLTRAAAKTWGFSEVNPSEVPEDWASNSWVFSTRKKRCWPQEFNTTLGNKNKKRPCSELLNRVHRQLFHNFPTVSLPNPRRCLKPGQPWLGMLGSWGF